MKQGLLAILPLALGVATYGFAFGILAAEAGFSPEGIATMAVAVFAGSSQIAAVDQFLTTGTVLGAALAGAALNIRYIGIVASVTPLLKALPWPTRLIALQGATDENFGLTLAARRADPSVGGRFLLGTCFGLILAWMTSTVAGAIVGQAIPDLDRFGIGFAFTAAFIAMARALWPGRTALIPWGVAFAVTVLLIQAGLPSAAALVIGALSGVGTDFVVNRDDG
ncbi:MAG: AzlC family ABC transporter permease [Pseudomonadota bacterium]